VFGKHDEPTLFRREDVSRDTLSKKNRVKLKREVVMTPLHHKRVVLIWSKKKGLPGSISTHKKKRRKSLDVREGGHLKETAMRSREVFLLETTAPH